MHIRKGQTDHNFAIVGSFEFQFTLNLKRFKLKKKYFVANRGAGFTPAARPPIADMSATSIVLIDAFPRNTIVKRTRRMTKRHSSKKSWRPRSKRTRPGRPSSRTCTWWWPCCWSSCWPWCAWFSRHSSSQKRLSSHLHLWSKRYVETVSLL